MNYLFVENNYYVSVEYSTLIFKGDDGIEKRINVDDIEALIFATNSGSISIEAINKIVKTGVNLIFTDDKHLPTIQYISCYGNYKISSRLELQINKYKKQDILWKRIVKTKINNYAKLLEKSNFYNESEKLISLSDLLKDIEDADTLEAQAAKEFFNIYGPEFKRFGDDFTNACLNYGYAILRSSITQNLVSAGLSPSIGIHHRSMFNKNNLSDDIIEQYRFLVDQLYLEELYYYEEFSFEVKEKLVLLLEKEVIVNNKLTTVSKAIKDFCYDYIKYLNNDIQLNEIRFFINNG